MRFMMIVKANERSEAGLPPEPRLLAAVQTHAEEQIKAGVRLDTGGLAPSSQGARIIARGGKLTKVDGPFPETKELIGGYAVLQARSKEEAIEHGLRFMRLHQELIPGWEGEMEVRQIFGPENPHGSK